MNGYKERGKAYYRRKILISEDKIEAARLIFDGVLGKSTVYVNGTVAARNFSGYNRFSLEIGDYLLPGEENTVIVEVDASRGEGWFYEGAGIYRAARIEMRHFSHLIKENSFVFSHISYFSGAVVLPTVLIAFLALISILIFVRKEKELQYKTIAKTRRLQSI